MTILQKLIIWVFGLLAAGVLYFVGMVSPTLTAKSSKHPDEILGKAVMEVKAEHPETYRRMLEDWQRRTSPNPYIGVLVPIAILGCCAFLSTIRGSLTGGVASAESIAPRETRNDAGDAPKRPRGKSSYSLGANPAAGRGPRTKDSAHKRAQGSPKNLRKAIRDFLFPQ